ncbi:SDR family oxidoreductase [Lichenifustis flavocetrariae]|uniref:SDR family oxidoreductase n=1 Tax=Lichenifustis flavocetrariae TaxID=2949735 RepID=A0AA41Z9K0_9HYPH|nr:SDR family oxidoreductase [Lichenifustis flavocetrariae]MCW6511802.1 SDR family oxidoreductase [Lichenifustis flavocetrariae]
MRVFLTGATGFIGSRIVPELLQAGHEVIGMTRSEEGAQRLTAQGATPHRATLEDLDSIRRGAEQADGVIHCGFDHDFSNFVANCEKDRRVIGALGSLLNGSDRPLLITSGTGLGSAPGKPADEDVYDTTHANPRKASEEAGQALLDAGVDVRVVRLPQVHDTVQQGLITPLVAITREKGLSAYVGEGKNRFPAAHVTDVARLYRLALEKGEKGARYNAVAEEGVSVRTVAEILGKGLNVPVKSITPEEVPAHFGWMAMFAGMDLWASGAKTQARLDWHPTGPGLIEDLERMDYSVAH